MTRFVVPTILYSGGNDYLADPDDVNKLVASVPNGTILKHVKIADYSHLDFTWAVDANQLVYESLIASIP